MEEHEDIPARLDVGNVLRAIGAPPEAVREAVRQAAAARAERDAQPRSRYVVPSYDSIPRSEIAAAQRAGRWAWSCASAEYASASLDRLWDGQDPEGYDVDRITEPGRRAPAAVSTWLDSDRKRLLLRGPTRRGKTMVGHAIIRAAIERQAECFVVSSQTYLAAQRPSDGPTDGLPGAEVKRRAETAALLLLDDLGAGKDTLWGVGTLEHLLDVRDKAGGRTIITTNLLTQQALLDRFGGPLVGRILEWSRTALITSPRPVAAIAHF